MKRESFGETLQRLRAEAGLTQVKLSEAAGVPLTTLRNWETNRREPLASALFKLVSALGISADAFKDSAPATPAQSAKNRNGKQSARRRKDR